MSRLINVLRLSVILMSVAPALAAEPRFVKAWGKEGSADGEFHFCIGLAIHGETLYVTDHYNDRVQAFDFDGKHLLSFPVLPHPGGIAADKEGRLYITHFPAAAADAKQDHERISIYDPQGKFIREFGNSGSGDGELSWPGGLTIGPDGNIYVADQTNHRVQVFDKEGKFLAKFGEYGTGPGQFGGNTNPKSRAGGPQFVAFDQDGDIYATEGMPCRVQKLTQSGKPLLLWGEAKDEPGHFGGKFSFKDKPTEMQGPIGLTVDASDNTIWVVAISGRIQQFDTNGKYLGGIHGGQGREPGQFKAPHAIAINAKGEIFVADSYNQRVQKFAK